MEENQSKGIYLAQILSIVGLGFIIMLFKLVRPLSWTSQVLPVQWIDFFDQLQYAVIELVLLIVICYHFIFGQSFKALGLKNIKSSLKLFILNGLFMAGCVGTTYLNAQLSKVIHFDGLSVALMLLKNFIAYAFVRELIFRGWLLRAFEGLMGRKTLVTFLVSGVVVSVLTAVCDIPRVIMALDIVSSSAVMKVVAYSFLFNLYLCLLYSFSDNIWLCMILHGVFISIGDLQADFFNTLFYGAYLMVMVFYLVWSIVKYHRDEVAKEEFSDVEAVEDEIQDLEEANQPLGTALEENQVMPDAAVEEMMPSHIEQPKAKMQEMQTPKMQEIQTPESEYQVSKEQELDKKVDIPYFKEMMPQQKKQDDEAENLTDDVNLEQDVEKESEHTLDTHDDDDFEETVVMPPIIEGKLDETVVIPAVEHPEKKEGIEEPPSGKVISLAARTRKQPVTALNVKPEPNFIGHLEKYLGDFEGIFKQMTPTDPPIDIMFFKGERYNALVTNGMRSMPMTVPAELGHFKYVELMMFLDKDIEINNDNIENEENAWLIKLLIDLALFPTTTGGYLGVGHIVGNGEKLEPYSDQSQYCGAMIFQPMEQENVKFCRYVEKGNTIYIYNVLPLFKDELRFIQEHSSDQFINLMSEMGVRQIVKRNRIDVIKTMKDEKE